MPDLSFQIEAVSVVACAAAPTLAFKLRVTNAAPNEAIHSIALRCQIQLEVARRRYTPEEQERMLDLFGTPNRWSQTLRTMHWTNAYMVIPAFQGATTTSELQVPCTFDFNVATTKYFDGLADGEIPLLMLFSGTVFFAPPEGGLQVAPISWEKDAHFKLPVKVWREMMDIYYPNCVWLNLRRDVFERLYRYKMERGIPSWEQALEEVLPAEEMVKS
jgi:hypothetical protein